MLLDEPFGALDALTRAMMQRWLLDVWQKYRRTILFITHDVDEAIFLGDRVLVMTARPGSVKLEQVVDLPRPRLPEIVTAPEFVRLKRTLLDAIEEESMKILSVRRCPGEGHVNVHSSGQPSSPAAGAIDSGEWDARVKLAACYRMVARLGMDDLIYNHISARVPEHEDRFLINPYGLLFDEINASTLVKITPKATSSTTRRTASMSLPSSSTPQSTRHTTTLPACWTPIPTPASRSPARRRACCRSANSRCASMTVRPSTTMKASPSISTNRRDWCATSERTRSC